MKMHLRNNIQVSLTPQYTQPISVHDHDSLSKGTADYI